VDGQAGRWYDALTAVRNLSPGTAVRHFNVMRHMMEKASSIWSKDTGIDRNPADQVDLKQPDDQRDRYLSEDEVRKLKQAWMTKRTARVRTKLTRRIYRLRLIVLIAVITGMRASEIFGLKRSDVMYSEGPLAVRGRENALRPDASGSRRRTAAVSRRDW
jgi:integrase